MRSSNIGKAALLLASVFCASARAGDADAGRSIFHAKCAICHSVVPGQNRVGPSLAAIVGRPAATEANYSYSAGMKASGKIWDAATLDIYLANPRGTVPGTKMAFGGIADTADRGNLIAYLATLK